MGYRKITVDGKEYEYTIGRSHVKVKGVGVWPKEEIGSQYLKTIGDAESFLAKYKDVPLKNMDSEHVDVRVLPSDIAEKIRQQVSA